MRIRTSLRLAALVFVGLLAPGLPIHAGEPVKEVRLYALDTGRIQIKDLGGFSDTGEYDGKPGTLAAPSFVIRHPKGTLVWDTGLGDALAEKKEGLDVGMAVLSVPTTLASQLKALDLPPAEVTYVAFSHFHFDHTGNANLFGASTWIINKAELAWALSEPTPFGADPKAIGGYKSAKTQMIDGDHDVFGDGTVRILKAPGHTPGHQVLMVKLKNAGTVILSGDLYHLLESREHRRIPVFNTERADTLASMDRVETLVKNTKARFVVQHSEADFKALPKFPAYLD